MARTGHLGFPTLLEHLRQCEPPVHLSPVSRLLAKRELEAATRILEALAGLDVGLLEVEEVPATEHFGYPQYHLMVEEDYMSAPSEWLEIRSHASHKPFSIHCGDVLIRERE